MYYECMYVSLCVLLARAEDGILMWDNDRALFSYRRRIPSHCLTVYPTE